MKSVLRIILLFIILFSLIECQQYFYLFIDPDYDPHYDIIKSIKAKSIDDISLWIAYNINYIGDEIHDTDDYWQSPDQTYVWKCGDCEDYAILFMYFIRWELSGEKPELVIGTYGENGHAWIKYNEIQYEPQNGIIVNEDSNYKVKEIISYSEAMWRSENTHRSILKSLK